MTRPSSNPAGSQPPPWIPWRIMPIVASAHMFSVRTGYAVRFVLAVAIALFLLGAIIGWSLLAPGPRTVEKIIEKAEIPTEWRSATVGYRAAEPDPNQPLLAKPEWYAANFTTAHGQRLHISGDGEIRFDNISCSYGASVFLTKPEVKALLAAWVVVLKEQSSESATLIRQMANAARRLSSQEIKRDAIAATAIAKFALRQGDDDPHDDWPNP